MDVVPCGVVTDTGATGGWAEEMVDEALDAVNEDVFFISENKDAMPLICACA